MNTRRYARFALGQVLATEGATDACSKELLIACLRRHSIGDWGDLEPEDVALNDQATLSGGRLLSAYTIDPARGLEVRHLDNTLWIITESDRSVTTFLLPSEY
jgi:hypothetical protein